MFGLLVSRWFCHWILSPSIALWTRSYRPGHVLLPLVLILSLSLGIFSHPAHATPQSRVLPQLQREASKQPNKTFRVIVTRINRNTAADSAVKALGGQVLKEVAAEAFVAEMPGKAIEALGRNPAVKYVSPDALMNKASAVDGSKLGTVYPGTINAPELWSGTSAWTGQGIGVAVLDTGLNSSLCDYKRADGTSRVVVQAKFNSNTTSQADGHGHGTHVMGIIAGNSWHCSNTAVQGKYIGIAPRANIINVKVSDDQGMSYTSDVVNAIDWVVTNRVLYNIRVMNLSLVSSVAESAKTSTLAAAVERAWFNGIFVVVSAGNAGPDTMYYPPANDPFVVTVGAADPMGTVARSDDTIAPWSSYGTTQDGYSKPDVAAPGRYATAPLASGACTLAKQFPSRIVDSTYIWLSGTSMSAPVVAGLAALAFQAHPEWTNDQVKWLLQNTATNIGSAGQGAGLVDGVAVVRYTGTPGLANQGLIINEQLVGPGGLTTYNADSTSSWSTSSWSTSSWSTSSWSTSSWSTANLSTMEFAVAEETVVE